MRGRTEKEKINVLLNIDNYYGEHRGRLAPTIVFLLVSAMPFVFYIFFLTEVISIKWMLIFEVLFAIRMAFFILGKENEKLRLYKQIKEDEFASALNLVRVSHVHEDGLIEYMNGFVGYIVSAFTYTYFNDSKYSIDLEEFLAQIKEYEYDIHGHLVVDESRLQDDLEQLQVYEDKDMLKERMKFYIMQDEYAAAASKLYRINILVKTYKSDWKRLRMVLDESITSSYSKVFKSCQICNREQVSDVMSRDICAYIDIAEMLQNKYKNESYFGSKVLFYGDEIPEDYKEKKEAVGLQHRRATEDTQKQKGGEAIHDMQGKDVLSSRKHR